MERLFTITLLLSAALVFAILHSLRRAHIRVEYSLSWLAAALVILVLSAWPDGLRALGGWLGVNSAPAALGAVTLCGFLVVLYRLSMIVSELKDNNVALAQKVAALEFHLQRLEEETREANARR
ncbi:MAG: DUF2304 domain-containing protein [Bryobacterales bacterium]|nr:DUF2304 domain-containing protein [Bryobacterales bacterium]